MEKKEMVGIPINLGDYNSFVSEVFKLTRGESGSYVCIANVHMLIEAYNTEMFSSILNSASIITPDGKPLTWGLRLLYGIRQDRVAGMDLLPDLLRHASQEKLPIFFYGGTSEMLDK